MVHEKKKSIWVSIRCEGSVSVAEVLRHHFPLAPGDQLYDVEMLWGSHPFVSNVYITLAGPTLSRRQRLVIEEFASSYQYWGTTAVHGDLDDPSTFANWLALQNPLLAAYRVLLTYAEWYLGNAAAYKWLYEVQHEGIRSERPPWVHRLHVAVQQVGRAEQKRVIERCFERVMDAYSHEQSP